MVEHAVPILPADATFGVYDPFGNHIFVIGPVTDKWEEHVRTR